MKFILMMEEDGYEFRYWDDIADEIGETIFSSWDRKEFKHRLFDMDFNISKESLERAFNLVDTGERSFVILCSKNKPNHLDTLHEDVFEVEP